MHANPLNYFAYYLSARIVVILLSIACGACIFAWGRRMYGDATGLICSGLWFSDPSVNAFSSVITADVGAAAFGILAAFSFWRSLEGRSIKCGLAAGAMLGFAQAAKFSMLLLYPVFLTAAVSASVSRAVPAREKRLHVAVLLGIEFVVSFLVINSVYLFEGSFSRLDSFEFRSALLTRGERSAAGEPAIANRFRGSAVGSIPLPLPRRYVEGLDSLKSDEERPNLRLEHGRLVRGGSWYTPYVTLFYKLPMGTLAAFVACVVHRLIRMRDFRGADVLFCLTIVCTFGFFGGQTGMNWAVRYLIPVFPFLYLAAGATLSKLLPSRPGKAFIYLCLAWNIWGLAIIRPCYLSFGNELAGGARGAQAIFIGSNFDWGQDLRRLEVLRSRSGDRTHMVITFHGAEEPELVGLKRNGLPPNFLRGDTSGSGLGEFYWAVSSNVLHGVTTWITMEDGRWLLGTIDSPHLRPEFASWKAGESIYVFKISKIDGKHVLNNDKNMGLAGCVSTGSGFASDMMP